ncbi:MAG: hypothetical protein IPM79_13590 [Polyangiaceae bacterium]|nr:hypothetical protein [Polyangiaceae bacterium]MBK8938631.1 hypothetical protein [Polyangiaceae bacterium]
MTRPPVGSIVIDETGGPDRAAAASAPRPRVTARQLALVSAITKSPELKRRLVGATDALQAGLRLCVGGEPLTSGAILGSGLVGVVSAGTLDRGQRPVALKRARARLAFFREALRVERAVASSLVELGPLRAADVLFAGDHTLVKELVTAPTLAELLVRGGLERAQERALEGVLEVVRFGLSSWGVALDVSPKNLAWHDEWVLLDAGPKLRVGDLARVAELRSFSAYVDAYRAKLSAGPSAPSAVTAPAAGEELLEAPERHVFVRELWQWFPLDPSVDAHSFSVDVDESMASDEIVIERDARGVVWVEPGTPHAIQEAAEAAWRGVPSTSPARGPSLAAVARTPTGRLYRALGAAPPPLPAALVRPYRHWRDVLAAGTEHTALDLHCHEPLADPSLPQAPRAPEGLPRGATSFRARVPTPAGTFAELSCVVAPGSDRAIVLVPGFRAGVEATHALVSALLARGHAGVFVSAYLGARNPDGQALVTGGAWETPLLVHVLDYTVACLEGRSITLVAASHGAAAAMEVAALHPLVDRLVLDSPLARPLELYFHVARARGQALEQARAELREGQLPAEVASYAIPEREGLEVLALRPVPDLLTDVCGFPEGPARVVEYAGPHAATMRHDAHVRGVPEACIAALEPLVAR